MVTTTKITLLVAEPSRNATKEEREKFFWRSDDN